MIFPELFITFFRIGLFTFGGGYAMIPLIRSEVLGHGWMNIGEIIDFIAVSESTPGPFAVNISTFTGMTTAGVFGAFCATLGVVLPSFIIILIVARLHDRFRESRVVKGAMTGLRPAVIGLIASALVSIGTAVFFPEGISVDPAFLLSAAIFALTAFLAFKKKHPIMLIGLSAAIGIAAGYAFDLPV